MQLAFIPFAEGAESEQKRLSWGAEERSVRGVSYSTYWRRDCCSARGPAAQAEEVG